MTTRVGLTCSFCGKSESQVSKLVAGPGVCICDGCVELARQAITESEEQEDKE